MTNAEKYLKDNLKENDFADMCVYLTRYFDNEISMQKVAKFFKKEATPTLTEDERVILKNLKVEKYIFRDSYGDLLISETKPTENEIRCGDLGYVFDIYNHLFQFIKERRRIRDRGVIE